MTDLLKPPPPPPRLLVIASLVVLGVTTVIAVIGAFHTGITTDEPVHVMRLRNFADNGWYAVDWDYSGGSAGGAGTTTYVYGPVAMLLLHAFSVLCGAEGIHHVSTSQHAYEIRHLGVVLIGLVGLAAVAAIGRVVLRSWPWGLVAAAALAAVPLWTGQEMFNVKDVPVATGYTLTTLGLLLFVRHRPPPASVRAARCAVLLTGLVLTLGTRPGMWAGVVAVGVVAVLGIALQRRAVLVTLVELATVCVLAAATLIAIYPNLYAHPVTALERSTESSSSFAGGATADRLYVPKNLAAQMPTLLLVFILIGLLAGAVLVGKRWRSDPVPSARIALVGVQTLALPAVAILLGSDLYHGLRQLLFATPTAAVLAAYGIAWALPRRRWVAAVAAVALVLPTVDQVTLFPYETTYANLASDLVTAHLATGDDRPGSDYWLASIPELIEHRRLDRQLLCKAVVSHATDRAYRFIEVGSVGSVSRSLDCREEPNGPLKPRDLPVVREGAPTEYYAVFQHEVPRNCRPVDQVTRWRHGFTTRLTVLALCDTPAAPLGARRVSIRSGVLGFARPGDLWLYLVDGWWRFPRASAMSSPVPAARLAFRPVGCNAGCTLEVTGSAPADVQARIGSEPTTVRRGRFSLAVPISAAQAAAPDGVWITFTRRSGAPLGMKVSAVRLAGTG